jgi:hypothetical protein
MTKPFSQFIPAACALTADIVQKMGRVSLVLAMMLMSGAGFAVAEDCEGAEMLFEDMFDDNLSSWDTGDRGAVKGGRYYITPQTGNYNYSSDLHAFYFGDAEYCITLRFEKIGGEYLGAGILFWFEDWDNNFNASLYSDGDLWIRREKGGEFTTIQLVKDIPSLNQGVGGENRLMVRTKGSVVTVFVNGAEVHKFRAQKPSGETQMGLYASGKDGENQASFDDLRITSVE